VRVEQTFRVARPPEAVFDYMTDPAHLPEWQTVKTSAEQITPGPRGAGTRIRERTKPPVGREFEQIVEFSRFERPRMFATHIVEGPAKVDGTWTFAPDGDGTRVQFVAEGPLPGPLRVLEPVARRVLGRQFARYHEKLRRNLEAG
jgi:carbon monoxide dehydrogenase subunit G